MEENEYNRIAKEIHSDTNPRGIDTKKTHITIQHKLNEIKKRLERLENEHSNNNHRRTQNID